MYHLIVGADFFLQFFVSYYHASFRSEFCGVMSVTISQLFVGGFMSYLHYLFLFAYCGVQHLLCFCFCFCLTSSCVPYVASCPLLVANSVFSNVHRCIRCDYCTIAEFKQ